MAASLPVPDPASVDADRVCVHCGKVVSPDRERICDHCGLPFRGGANETPVVDEPGVAGRLLLKVLATLAVVLPPLGPLTSLTGNAGTLLGLSLVVLANAAAMVFAWRRPLTGGILVALAGTVPVVIELIVDAAGVGDPSSRYWLFWFLPGGLVGGALFVAAAFWRNPVPSDEGRRREVEDGTGGASLVERVRREAIGLAVIVVVGFVFAAVLASNPNGTDLTANQALPATILLIGFPLLLVGAGVLGYREGRARGSFVAGLVSAALAVVAIEVALKTTGQTLFKVGEGEWIGEAYLIVGLAIVAGGFFGLLGGGVMALLGGLLHRSAHS